MDLFALLGIGNDTIGLNTYCRICNVDKRPLETLGTLETLETLEIKDVDSVLEDFNITPLIKELLKRHVILKEECKNDIVFIKTFHEIKDRHSKLINQMKELIYTLIGLFINNEYRGIKTCISLPDRYECRKHCFQCFLHQKKHLSYELIIRFIEILERFDSLELIYCIKFIISDFFCHYNILAVFNQEYYITGKIQSSFDLALKRPSAFNIILIYFYYILNDDPKYVPLFKKIMDIIFLNLGPKIDLIFMEGLFIIIANDLYLSFYKQISSGNKYEYMLYLLTLIIYKYNFEYYTCLYAFIQNSRKTGLLKNEVVIDGIYTPDELAVISKQLEILECITLCSPNRVAWISAIMRFAINK